jgi:hypothetical protein
MPEHANWPIPTPAHNTPVPPSAAGPAAQALLRGGYPPVHTTLAGPGAASTSQEATTVLPRRPYKGVGLPPVAPVPPGLPAWAAGPGYPSAFTGPRLRRRPKWALIAGGAVVVVSIVGAAVMVNAAGSPDDMGNSMLVPAPRTSAAPSQPSPAPQAPTVPLSALPGLMLDISIINSIEGATNIAPSPDLGNDDTAYHGLTTDHPECSEIQAPALDTELDNSGWIGVRTQSLQDPKGAEHLNHSAAIYFATAKAASDFAAKQAQAWPKCNGATLHVTTNRGSDGTWIAGTATSRDGALSITNTEEGARGWQCQRALTARNNIVIDVRSCGNNRTDEAIKIATRMAERVNPR